MNKEMTDKEYYDMHDNVNENMDKMENDYRNDRES